MYRMLREICGLTPLMANEEDMPAGRGTSVAGMSFFFAFESPVA